MNQQTNSPELNIIPSAGGSVEDEIMAGSGPAPSVPADNLQNADKALADQVGKAVEKSPQGDSDDGNSGSDTSAPEGKGYEPAKEFLDFIQSQVEDGYQTPEQQQQRAASPPEPQKQSVADDSSAPVDPAVKQQMDSMQNMIQDLTNTIHQDRNMAIDRGNFETVNDVYLDVVKDVPEEALSLVNVWNNAVLGYHDLPNINQSLIQGSTKAITSELDNYFNTRIANEGYAKSGSVPPSVNSSLGEITPPPPSQAQAKDYGDPNNRPIGAFDAIDKDFARKVNNLFSQ